MSLASRSSLSLLLVASLIPACGGGDDSSSESPDARPTSRPADAAVVDASTPDARPDPSTPDAGVDAQVPTGVISNLPVEWQAAPGSSTTVKLVSSNFEQQVSGSNFVYQNWLGELRNDGSTPACLIRITLELQDASGRVLASMLTYADGPAYKTAGSTVSSSCIPPGGSGALWTNATPPSPAVLEQATRAVYNIRPFAGATPTPHPLAPEVTGTAVVSPAVSRWALRGNLRATAGTIYNIGLDVYPIGAQGWPLDHLSATHLDTLARGSTWNFQTTSVDQQFTRSLVFPGFIEGARTVRVAPSEEPAFAAAADAARIEREASEARRAERDAQRAE